MPVDGGSSGGSSGATTNQAGTLQAVFGGRIQRDSATQISLQRYVSDICWVADAAVSIGASGLTLLTTTNLASSTGTDSGGAMGASTLYYVYLANASGSYRASSLVASATAPAGYVTTANGHRGRYLATSGNGANYLFVGYAYTDGSTQFVDTVASRTVVNWYNRLALSLLVNPAYADDNADTTYTITGTNYSELNGSARVGYISNGADSVHLTADAPFVAASATGFNLGIGIDTAAGAAVFGCELLANARGNVSCTYTGIDAEGYHFAAMVGTSHHAANTSTIYADTVRYGGTADPRGAKIMGYVMG